MAAHHHRPRQPHRRPAQDRCRRGRWSCHRGMVLGHDVPGHGDRSAGPGSARRVAARAAHLRHLQRRPCHRLGARGGAGARHQDPDQCPADPQRPHRHAVRARPCHGALPGEPPGLGGHERHRGCRSRGDLTARARRAAPGRTPPPAISATSGTASPPSSRRSSRDRSPRRGPAIRPTGSPRSRACCSWPTCSRRSTGRLISGGSRRCSPARRLIRRPTWWAGCRSRHPGAGRRSRGPGSIRRSRTTTRPSRSATRAST